MTEAVLSPPDVFRLPTFLNGRIGKSFLNFCGVYGSTLGDSTIKDLIDPPLETSSLSYNRSNTKRGFARGGGVGGGLFGSYRVAVKLTKQWH